MKTNAYYLAITGAAAILLTSCGINCKEGSGNTTTQTYKVEDFTRVDVGGGYKIILKQDSSLNVNITTDDNLHQYIKTSVSGGVLHIKSKKSLCPSGEATLVIGVRNLEGIEGSGAIEVHSDGTLNVKNIDLDFSGAGSANLSLNAANVRTSGSGATELKLRGQASSHSIDLSGNGSVDAFDFVVGDYNIETSGASDCKINVLNSLNVNTTGASSIEYKGNPKNVNNHKTGASDLRKVN